LSTRSGRSSPVPGFTYRARSGKSTYYRLETFLLEGSQGNDLMDYSKEQVITDILDQYERHLNFIHLHREAPGNSVMFPDTCYFLQTRNIRQVSIGTCLFYLLSLLAELITGRKKECAGIMLIFIKKIDLSVISRCD
jgi:hypothetical protein